MQELGILSQRLEEAVKKAKRQKGDFTISPFVPKEEGGEVKKEEVKKTRRKAAFIPSGSLALAQNIKDFVSLVQKGEKIEDQDYAEYRKICADPNFQGGIVEIEEKVKEEEGVEKKLKVFVDGVIALVQKSQAEREKREKQPFGADELLPFLTLVMTQFTGIDESLFLELVRVVDSGQLFQGIGEEAYMAMSLHGAIKYLQEGTWKK